MNPDSKYTVKKTFSAETVVFPVIFIAFFAYLSMRMGMANMINTIMKTAFDLLINTVLYIVAVCVIMGAVSELLTEFGFVALMDRLLRRPDEPRHVVRHGADRLHLHAVARVHHR